MASKGYSRCGPDAAIELSITRSSGKRMLAPMSLDGLARIVGAGAHSPRNSFGTVASRDDEYRPEEDFEIQQERPVTYVAEVQPHHLVKSRSAATLDLPKAGHSGPYFLQPSHVPRLVLLGLI